PSGRGDGGPSCVRCGAGGAQAAHGLVAAGRLRVVCRVSSDPGMRPSFSDLCLVSGMQRDLTLAGGEVRRLTVESDALKGNLLGDPSTRRVDVYLPHGGDGAG